MKLITKAIENQIKKYPLYSQDGLGENAKVIVKFFFGNWTWLATEGQISPDGNITFFGSVINGHDYEWGYFDLKELESVKFLGYPCVERDRWFKTGTTVKEAMEEIY